jgi:hypothetical protein
MDDVRSLPALIKTHPSLFTPPSPSGVPKEIAAQVVCPDHDAHLSLFNILEPQASFREFLCLATQVVACRSGSRPSRSTGIAKFVLLP